jgi:hypothetical protein
MNEAYLNEFLRLVLTISARTVTIPVAFFSTGSSSSGEALTMFSRTRYRAVESAFNRAHDAGPKIVKVIRDIQRKGVYKEICALKKKLEHHAKLEKGPEGHLVTQSAVAVKAAGSRLVRTVRTQLARSVHEDYVKMRGEFVNVVREFSSLCAAGGEYNEIRKYILDMDELERRHKRLRRENKTGSKARNGKRTSANGLFSSGPSPSPQERENPTPFEEWERRPLSAAEVDVFVRMIHHNLWLWTSGTRKGWQCVTELVDEHGIPYAGYNVNKKRGGKRVWFSKNVTQLPVASLSFRK